MTHTTNPVKKTIIVGGGSAGWLTAGLLAAAEVKRHGPLSPGQVTLIESPDVRSIGVGEGTWPTMRATLMKIGISEIDLISQCDASFKQASKFSGWVNGGPTDHYYHPFSLPHQFAQMNLSPHWQASCNHLTFADAVSVQSYLCEQGLGPKLPNTPQYAFMANYGYHLDAGKFAQLLKQHCIDNLGVTYLSDHVEGINGAPNGDIASLSTKAHGMIGADLFIDCSGQAALLIGQHYKIPFISRKDVLFNDSALAVQVPYLHEQSAIASYTLSTAQSAGWIWDIGLSSRRGVGYVYSSAHQGDDEAEQTLRKYLRESSGEVSDKSCSKETASLVLRKITFDPGHRATFWHKNCVAVGMSAGFLEPLEASALMMVELAANMISEQLPANREVMDIIAERFNDKFHYRWERIIDFLKLHYVLSQRTDSAYWQDNKQAQTIPKSLQNLLSLWRYQPVWHHDFNQSDEIFSAASYQYVLHGMGFETQRLMSQPEQNQMAAQYFAQNAQMADKFLKALPSNRALIDAIKRQCTKFNR